MRKLFIAVACSLLAGCHQTEEMEFVDEDLKMSVVASIQSSNNQSVSRYAGDNPNSISFKSGDEIGIAVNGEMFVKWIKDNNGDGWSPEGEAIFWEDKSKNHSFVAFYPFAENATMESVPMPDLSDQKGDMNSVAAKDFLFTTKEQSYGTNGVVEFNRVNDSEDYSFKHISSLVIVTLNGEGELSSATIDKISISGNNIITPSACKINGENFIVELDETENKNLLELSLSHQMGSSDKTFYFVVNSGTVSLSAVTLSISYTTSQGSYIATLNGLGTSEVTSFERGKKYSYSLKVAGGELIISGNAIQDWGEGLNLGDIVINGIKQAESNDGNN